MSLDFVSIVIPAHNEERYLSQCLTSLFDQGYPSDKYEIILVNNNSTDRTQKIAESFKINIIEQKIGPVGAVRNAGAVRAQGSILAFIDADCVAPDDWLFSGSQLLKKPNCVYGGGADLKPSPHWIENAWLLENKLPPKELLGCCIFIKKTDFIDIGGFDETITSGEDTKLSVSLRERDFDVKMTDSLNVIHLGNPTTIKYFFIRQIWHSENYLQNWVDTKRDPTFYLLLLFLVSVTAVCFNFLLNKPDLAMIFLTIALTVPMIFTIKRLRRSKNMLKNLRNFIPIYSLDFLYLLGRSVGLGKSILKRLSIISLGGRSEG